MLRNNILLSETNIWKEFFLFQEKFNKNYDEESVITRFEIFRDNFINIYSHNHNPIQQNFTMGITQFTDLTQEEFKKTYLGFKHPQLTKTTCSAFVPTSKSVPASVDWRTQNAVTPVKDQGQCGSCWSFSATGAIEGAWAIAKKQLNSLSEQQLVDCSHRYGNLGCNGGLMDSAFQYTIDYGGLCEEKAYPYTATGGTCQTPCKIVSSISKCSDVEPNNQISLKEAVSNGPVSIAIEADTAIFQSYSSGVITSKSCGTSLDHGVLIVGYGIQDNIKYWLVKNSWGTSWGDGGYVKIERSDSVNDPGICGIAMEPSFPIV